MHMESLFIESMILTRFAERGIFHDHQRFWTQETTS